MQASEQRVPMDDGVAIHRYEWRAGGGAAPRAVVHICHGMAEHAGRYARLAEALTGAGYLVRAHDQRGHGRTAPSSADLGFVAERDGFRRLVRDLVALVASGRADFPDLPQVLLGHSMGAEVVHALLCEEAGGGVAAASLSAPPGMPSPLVHVGRAVSRVERLRLGRRGKSPVMHMLGFGSFNRAFRPNRTEADWLSRDAAEVDRYIADPLCGFQVSVQLWVDFLDALVRHARADQISRIPAELPLQVQAGGDDPVGERTRAVSALVGAYRAAGLRRVSHHYYPGARHEIFNEINRDEVTGHLLAWLDRALGDRAVLAA